MEDRPMATERHGFPWVSMEYRANTRNTSKKKAHISLALRAVGIGCWWKRYVVGSMPTGNRGKGAVQGHKSRGEKEKAFGQTLCVIEEDKTTALR